MNKYFIHTIELFKTIETDTYMELKKHSDFYRKNIMEERYINTRYYQKGLIIEIRKLSKNEIKTYGKAFMITLIINPSKLLYNGDPINHIYCRSNFKDAIKNMLELIEEADEKYKLYDSGEYTISRIDIARDVHSIPESIIKEVNKMLYRLPMYDGYSHNDTLENNCSKFKREDSFNAVNSSRGIEFVIYNKLLIALSVLVFLLG